MDRCYSYYAPYQKTPDQSRLASGKQVAFIMTQNRPDEMHSEIYIKYDIIFQTLNFTNNRLIRGCDLLHADDIREKKRYDLIDLAKETAREMVK